MPYAFHLNNNGTPDLEARARLDEAVRIARSKNFGTIFLGAGMQDYARKRGAASLSFAAWRYLRTKGWPPQQKFIWDTGHNTVTETLAFYSFLRQSHHRIEIETVTSWWHKPRVWLVCRIIFGRPITVHSTRSTLSLPHLCFCIARETAALPVSAFRARGAAKKLRAMSSP